MVDPMKRMGLSLLAVTCLLVAGQATSSEHEDFVQALDRGAYSTASTQAAKLPPAQVISRLRERAVGNEVPVQWILAEAYWRQGDQKNAFTWAYAALVGTQLDAAMCSRQNNVVAWMMQNHEPIFREARRNPPLQSEAISAAMKMHYKYLEVVPPDPAWACILGEHLAGRQALRGTGLTPHENIAMQRRIRAMGKLIRQSGVVINAP